MTLIDRIEEALLDGDGDREYDSERIIAAYQACNADAQEAINVIFILLCGWQLATLINNGGNP